MIACAPAIYRLTPLDKNKFFYFLPIPFFLIQAQHYESAFWTMAYTQNFFILFFIILVLVNLDKDTITGFCSAAIFSLFAIFTSGNGIFAFVCGTLLLMIKKRFNARLLIWSIFSLFSLFLHFYQYKFIQLEVEPFETLSKYPDQLLGAFFGVIGGALNFEKHHDTFQKAFGFLIAITVGFFVVVLFLDQLQKKLFFYRPVLFTLLIFFSLSLVAVALSRLSFGAEYMATASCFKIISVMIFILLYLIYIPNFFSTLIRKYVWLFVGLAIAYSFLAFRNNQSIIKLHATDLLRSSWLLHAKDSYEGLVHYDPGLVKPMLERSAELDNYHMADLSTSYEKVGKSRKVDIELLNETGDITSFFEILTDPNSDYYTIEHRWAFIKEKNSLRNKIYVVLKASPKTIIFDTEAKKRIDVTSRFGSANEGGWN